MKPKTYVNLFDVFVYLVDGNRKDYRNVSGFDVLTNGVLTFTDQNEYRVWISPRNKWIVEEKSGQ